MLAMFFFLLIAIHQIQKYLQNLKFVKLHSEDFFPTFWSGAAKTVLCLHAFDSTQTHLHVACV